MRKKLFEIAILLHPNQNDKDEGASAIVVAPTPVLATELSTATMLAGRMIPETHLDKLDRLEVAVRPF